MQNYQNTNVKISDLCCWIASQPLCVGVVCKDPSIWVLFAQAYFITANTSNTVQNEKYRVFEGCACCFKRFSTADGSASPTIILLPYGRMLVVDRNVFAQLQADHTGIDFMELSANLIRAQNIQNASNPSILESENTSKGLSPTSLDFLPPAYEDIFGIKNSDLPPSYSEISLMFRKLSREKLNAVRVSDKEIDITPIPQESILRTSFSAPFILNEGLFNFEHRMRHAFVSLENNLERNLSNCSEEEGCGNLSVEFIRSGENAQACNLQLNDRCEATNDDNVNVMEYIDRESSV
ncbi:hypothetical protein FQR65_LT04218 [Abscondita terminalis]|nr:hypothetical protein FQR65_LT04218 [Abscondita terminalis]